jgi:hypothetical protein
VRPFASLAHGLSEGCHDHFGVAAEVHASGSANRCRFHVRVAQEASCRPSR